MSAVRRYPKVMPAPVNPRFAQDGRLMLGALPEHVLAGTHPIRVRAAQARSIARRFDECGSSTHSGNGAVLWVILEHCAVNRIPIIINTMPFGIHVVAATQPSRSDPLMNDPQASVPAVRCELCTAWTTSTGTKRCDRCWELEHRIDADPDLAVKILERVASRGEPRTGLALRRSNFRDVQTFHDKFGIDANRPAVPRALTPELVRFRLGFLIEELAEFAKAAGATPLAFKLAMLAIDAQEAEIRLDDSGVDLVKAWDGLLDLVVVALGTADFAGLPWELGWDVVMARNMAKRRAASGSESKRRTILDIVKPEGWYGPEPELRAILIRAGWQP